MKNTKVLVLLFFSVFLGIFLLFPFSCISEELPKISLKTPVNNLDRSYLGLEDSDQDMFEVSSLDADLVIIELLSMYCPYCQAEAPAVNEFHKLAMKQAEKGITIRMIGIGASNTEFETNQFRDTYGIPFPIFPDKSLALYDLLKGEGTPGFIAVRLQPDKKPEIIHRQAGGFEGPDSFLQMLLEKVK